MTHATSTVDRLTEYTTVDSSGCYTWTGRKDRHGYGVMKVDGHIRFTHRLAYELAVGPIPTGLQIDHLCRNRACCNPTHLEPVTSRTNTMRSPIAPAAVNARKTACNSGHPLTGRNLYRDPGGYRHCRACRKQRTREWRARKAEAGLIS